MSTPTPMPSTCGEISCDECNDRYAALTAERDQLRAALALGQQNCDDAYEDLCDERDAARARAELAEASLHALRLVCGTTDADKFSTWVDRANARAERAEAELAKERARLDWLLKLRCEDETRDDIDAAMKTA